MPAIKDAVTLLGTKDAIATIAVKDLERAKKFYEGTLGLKPTGLDAPDEEVRVYRTGNSKLMVYRSQYAGTNQATSATWGLGKDLDAFVEALRAKGVSFEHYESMPGTTLKGDVHVFGDFKAAWFKDPDGNILHVNSGS
jgi:catechol 2,3-dioxygenase-like lactoylglutathione lyase family enzyme